MNAAQLRARARKAMEKRAEEIEEDESGDLNLIPFLDLLMCVMVFFMASISPGYLLGQINTSLPSSQSAEAMDSDPDEDPDDEPLGLVLSVTHSQLIVWSISGRVGDLNEPHAVIERTNDDDDGPPAYDYEQLNDVLYEVAADKWGGEERTREDYELILQADGDIPYETIVAVMDHTRERFSWDDEDGGDRPLEPEELALPAEGSPYDPDVHALFPDVVFSMGFE